MIDNDSVGDSFRRAAPQRRFTGPRLSRDELSRRGLITNVAFSLMGGDDAIQFLNNFDETLGGRPLDLATQSASGYSAVMAVMERRR